MNGCRLRCRLDCVGLGCLFWVTVYSLTYLDTLIITIWFQYRYMCTYHTDYEISSVYEFQTDLSQMLSELSRCPKLWMKKIEQTRSYSFLHNFFLSRKNKGGSGRGLHKPCTLNFAIPLFSKIIFKDFIWHINENFRCFVTFISDLCCGHFFGGLCFLLCAYKREASLWRFLEETGQHFVWWPQSG